MDTCVATYTTKCGGFHSRKISFFCGSDCIRVLEWVRPGICRVLARLPLPFNDPLCFMDELRKPIKNAFIIFPSEMLDAMVFFSIQLQLVLGCMLCLLKRKNLCFSEHLMSEFNTDISKIRVKKFTRNYLYFDNLPSSTSMHVTTLAETVCNITCLIWHGVTMINSATS